MRKAVVLAILSLPSGCEDMEGHKLVVLTTCYPLAQDSSAGIFIHRLVSSLLPRFNPTVVVPADQTDGCPQASEGITVLPFRYAPKPWRVLAHLPGGVPVALRRNRWLYLLVPFFLLSMLLTTLRASRGAAIIQANWAICGVVAGLAGKWSGLKVVTTVRGEDVTRAQKSRLDRALFRLCVGWSSRVVGVSESVVAWAKAEFPDCQDKFLFIENGVDDAFLAIARALKPMDAPVELVSVASLIPRKGLDLLIEALARLPASANWRLTLAGDGPERDALARQAAEAGLSGQICFLGAVAPSQIPAVLAAADLFVFTSHSEGRPNAVIEAMASGLPVIASDIPGTRDIVRHDETGLLFKDGDAGQLSGHLAELIADGPQRDRLGSNGRQWILREGLSWTGTGRRYADLFDELAGIAR